MARWIAVAASLTVSASLAVTPRAQAPAQGDHRSALDVRGVAARGFVDDPGTFFLYSTTASTSDCGGNPACDIAYTQYYVSRQYPNQLLVIAEMVGDTDPSMSNSDDGGIIVRIDSDEDRSDWDYRVWTDYTDYPLDEWLPSPVESYDGESWIKTDVTAYYMRTSKYWALSIEYGAVGIAQASMAVTAIDATGNEDISPSNSGTPLIPIAAMVAGAPSQPLNVRTEPGPASVAVSWSAPARVGNSPVTSYLVTADPGGATCTAVTTSGCTVAGLTGGQDYYFTVSAINEQGTGLPSDWIKGTPKSPYPSAPRILTETYKGKGKMRDVTLTWSKPPGATGFEIRWDLNGGPWTPWRKTKARSVTIKGLKWDKFTYFEVRAVNAKGVGPVAKELLYFGPR